MDRDRDHRLASCVRSFPDCLRHFVCFTKSVPNSSFVVARDNERTEAKPATTLDYFRAAIDKNHLLSGITLGLIALRIVVAAISHFVCHIY